MLVVDAHMHLNGTLQDPVKYPPLKDQQVRDEIQ
jgi:hypothetical protein